MERLVTQRVLVAAGAAVTAGIAVYWLIRPALGELQLPGEKNRIIRARTRAEAAGKTDLPYPPDAFPGGRLVRSAYGDIQVFEWGPEDGEKVLLIHGIGTPCVALGDMAKEFVRSGCRVMLFDLFGRGYSDAPKDIPFDERLYTSQILLAIASSPLAWTGPSAFHILGYSLGGALTAAFATYHANLLRSATLVCPGGIVRTSHIGWKSRLLYSPGLIPEAVLLALAKRRLRPQEGVPSADVPTDDNIDDDEVVDFDEVLVSPGVTVGDVVKWQLDGNDGFTPAYMSTIRSAPIYGQHKLLWKTFGEELAKRREKRNDSTTDGGLESGRICLILADKDPIVVASEWVEDAKAVLGEEAVDIRIVKGGHEIAISKGKEVARIAIDSWKKNRVNLE